jgi:hypothetical protein
MQIALPFQSLSLIQLNKWPHSCEFVPNNSAGGDNERGCGAAQACARRAQLGVVEDVPQGRSKVAAERLHVTVVRANNIKVRRLGS